MGGACGTVEVEEGCVRGFGGETWRNGAIWNTRLDGRIILKCI
jgi:hypothetical protein